MRKVETFVPLIEEAFEKNQTFKMPVNGTSMLPFINKTHHVVLDKPTRIKRNDMVLYKRSNGQYVLHRIFRVKKGYYVLLGDNQIYREYPIYRNQIIAKVIEVHKKDKIHKNHYDLFFHLPMQDVNR